jgi:hypothetical protein
VELADFSAESIIVEQQENSRESGWFDLDQIAKSFPETADTLLLDTYLPNEEAASARVSRLQAYAAALRRVPLCALRKRHILDR